MALLHLPSSMKCVAGDGCSDGNRNRGVHRSRSVLGCPLDSVTVVGERTGCKILSLIIFKCMFSVIRWIYMYFLDQCLTQSVTDLISMLGDFFSRSVAQILVRRPW